MASFDDRADSSSQLLRRADTIICNGAKVAKEEVKFEIKYEHFKVF